MKRHLSQIGLALCATACGLSDGAFAAEGTGVSPVPAFLSTGDVAPQGVKCQAVGDDVLAQQTGRGAGGEMISGFVLNLLSQWQLPNGATAVAQGSLSVAQNTANQLSANVSTLARVTDPGGGSGNNGANPNASVNGGQNVSVNGVSQITQVAGNGNLGINGAQIDFNNSTASVSTMPGGSNALSSAAENAAGTIKAGISFGGNGVTVALQTPAGISTQTITPSNAMGTSSIAQLLQIAGNNQQVANQLQLHLQTQQMSAAMIRQSGVLQALQNSISRR
ncbi:peptidase C39 [Paraburkholderia phosphatilytica]|uniref:peptidase C39 n=1 Tax=Paraburkholderia phosphatilytica TaxID=2282883 RepID=UPI000E4B21A8|nr:peptidase C39 [Paraburkholderia phosphatilytica]